MGSECEVHESWVVKGVCPECGNHVTIYKKTCGRIECPRCFRTWARRASRRIAARVRGYFLAGGTRYPPRHVVLEGEGTDRQAYIRRLRALGFTGGAIVLHPYRIRKEYQRMFELMAAKTGRNRYDILRESAIGSDALEYAPHAHCIVYGKGNRVPRGSSKFKYRVLRVLPDLDSLERLAFYVLGHVGVPEGNSTAYGYWGCCSTRRLKPSYEGLCQDDLRCDKCGAVMLDEDALERGFRFTIQIRKYIALGWHTIGHGPPRSGCYTGTGPP